MYVPGGIGAPIRLAVPARIGDPSDGYPTAYTEPDAGGRSFGNTVNIIVTLPNGNEVDFMVGHLDSTSPLANLPPGTVIPAGTDIGYQGGSGSVIGTDAIVTSHADGRNGYIATPEDLMWIVNGMYDASGGGY